jgi:hypothetical protein
MTSAELDTSAEWSECLVKHARQDLIFLHKLARKMESIVNSLKSRHMLGFNSVTNHSRLSTEYYVRILSCFPPKTLEKLDLVEDWSSVTKEFVEEIFQECLGVYEGYKGVRGSLYLKVICLIKKVWIALLDNLEELSGVASHVVAFAKKVRENLESLRDDEY